MPIVNYVREHIRFIEYACDEQLTGGERLVWYALMHIMNQHAQGNIWPDEFIRISNDRLLSLCPMKYDTLIKVRNSLKQRGLIDFQGGEKNKKSPAYRMIYFYPAYVAPSAEEEEDESISKKSIYTGVYTGVYTGGNTGGNTGVYTGDNIINNKDIQSDIPNGFPEDDEEEGEKDLQRARAYAAEARENWRNSFGKEPLPETVRAIAIEARNGKFDKGVLSRAIRTTAFRSAHNPIPYLMNLLCDWIEHKVKTEADADEYLAIFDGYYTGKDREESRKAFREERESDDEYYARVEKERREKQKREEYLKKIRENQKRQSNEEK